MTERPTLAIGLMSGTSLDGVDAALVRLDGPTHATLLDLRDPSLLRRGTSRDPAALDPAVHRASALARLHVRIAEWAAEAVQTVLAQAQVPASELSFIAFPGQTIWHEPPLVTWQLGEPAMLAERFGVRVVSGFRPRDVAAGGQGAPLVPMADVLLFAAAEAPRVLLNLGGMANLTYVPAPRAGGRGPRLRHRARRRRHRRGGAHGGSAALLRSRWQACRSGNRSTRPAGRGAPRRSVLRRAAAQEHRPRAVRRPVCPQPARSAHRVRRRRHRSRAHGAKRRRARLPGGRRPAAEVVASGGGCHHPGLMASLRAAARGAAGAPSAPSLRRALLSRRCEGSSRVCAAGLSHAARSAGQRPRRHRGQRLAGARDRHSA